MCVSGARSPKSMRSHREVFPGKAIILTGARSDNWPYYFVFSLLFPHSRNFCFSTWTTAPQITFDFMGCWRSWHAEMRLCVLSRTFFFFFIAMIRCFFTSFNFAICSIGMLLFFFFITIQEKLYFCSPFLKLVGHMFEIHERITLCLIYKSITPGCSRERGKPTIVGRFYISVGRNGGLAQPPSVPQNAALYISSCWIEATRGSTFRNFLIQDEPVDSTLIRQCYQSMQTGTGPEVTTNTRPWFTA